MSVSLPPSDIISLLESGHSCGLASLGLARSLDLDTVVPTESERAAEHFAKLRSEFVASDTRQRMLQALVKEADAQDGLLYGMKQAVAGVDTLDSHQAMMEALQEKNKQTQDAVDEIQSHTKGLASQIKSDIQKLLQEWSNVETAKANFAAAKEEPAHQTEAHLWAGVHAFWHSVEQVVQTTESVAQIKDVSALNVAGTTEALTAMSASLTNANESMQRLTDSFSIDPAARRPFDLEMISSADELLQKQLRLIAEWNGRCATLQQELQALQRAVPQIASFRSAASAAIEKGEALPPSPALAAFRTAHSVLSKLSGVSLLRSVEEEMRNEAMIPIQVLRITVGVRAIQAAAPSAVNMNDAYESPEAFAAAFLNNSTVDNAPYYILELVLNKIESASINGQQSAQEAVQLIKAKIVGVLPANAMDALQAKRTAAQQNAALMFQSEADDVLTEEMIEQRVQPCPSGVANHSASQLIQYATGLKNMDAVTFLVRELPFAMQQH